MQSSRDPFFPGTARGRRWQTRRRCEWESLAAAVSSTAFRVAPPRHAGVLGLETQPIVNLFNQLIVAGTTISAMATAFFVMLAGYQYLSAGGSVRAVESAKGSLQHALIGFAFIILCRVVANLVGGALSAPSQALGPSPSVALTTLATSAFSAHWTAHTGSASGSLGLPSLLGSLA
jgi:hypothetical protein